MGAEIVNHLEATAASSCISAMRGTMDSVSPKIFHHLQVTAFRCPVCAFGSAVNAKSSQISDCLKVSVASCLVRIVGVALNLQGNFSIGVRFRCQRSQTDVQHLQVAPSREIACAPLTRTFAGTQPASGAKDAVVVRLSVEQIRDERPLAQSSSTSQPDDRCFRRFHHNSIHCRRGVRLSAVICLRGHWLSQKSARIFNASCLAIPKRISRQLILRLQNRQ